ncbi:MAG TPA: hypothetical protein PKB03_02325 [Baekduia sp.]|nr:hypothetical protein [Baekduia sp.]
MQPTVGIVAVVVLGLARVALAGTSDTQLATGVSQQAQAERSVVLTVEGMT